MCIGARVCDVSCKRSSGGYLYAGGVGEVRQDDRRSGSKFADVPGYFVYLGFDGGRGRLRVRAQLEPGKRDSTGWRLNDLIFFSSFFLGVNIYL